MLSEHSPKTHTCRTNAQDEDGQNCEDQRSDHGEVNKQERYRAHSENRNLKKQHQKETYMIIQVGYGWEKRDVTVDEVRALQERLLRAMLTETDKRLLDALLSWVAIDWANIQVSGQTGG